MSEVRSLTPLNETDYGSIEAAVMETARGRWFLAEYARRNRHADTEILLGAMAKLEKSVSGGKAVQQVERIRFDLMEMSRTITSLKAEVAASGADGEQSRFMEATEALDAVVRTTESATSSILEAAEQIQEAAWTLREAGSDHALCDILDRRAADIYTACTFQDLTAQRTQKVVRTLRFIEGRINALIDAWSSDGTFSTPDAATNGQNAASGNTAMQDGTTTVPLSQSDIDVVIVEHEFTAIDDEQPYAFAQIEAAEIPAIDHTDFDEALDFDDKAVAAEANAHDLPPQLESAESSPAEEEVDFQDVTAAAPVVPVSAYRLPDEQQNTLSALDGLPVADKLKLFR